MGIELFLSSKKILDHVFEGASKGYNSLEVDEFLDKIINDYRLIESNLIVSQKDIDIYKLEIQNLKNQIHELEIELGKYKAKFSNIKPTDNVNSDNINYIQRINALESFLFKEGYDPASIK